MTVGAALTAGVLGRCPRCGDGRLFAGYLKLAPACRACGADFTMADVGDGATVFVILIVGAFVVPAALVAQLAYGWPVWASAALAAALTLGLSLALLPVAKGVLFTLQWTHKAGEGRVDGGAGGPD
ncbi:MAG: DUF983 domain-containing protein [Hyphomonadaceae bacterium]|nr:DUF983 domain-containing protein [Hyphomonadaceae bacterium]